jgi:1-acyl-sn-glycerol-3-phosphate acyltransferase
MLWIRSLLFYLGVLVITPVFSILAILLFPLNNVTRSRIASGWAYCTIFWLKLTCNLGVSVKGLENIPKHPSIILSKHQSAWETIALQTIFPPQIWVMKRELLMIPFLGWAFMALAAIPIDRSSGREALKNWWHMAKTD